MTRSQHIALAARLSAAERNRERALAASLRRTLYRATHEALRAWKQRRDARRKP